MESISIFWFRRDLRLEDNTALNTALSKGKNVLPLFIFDEEIINAENKIGYLETVVDFLDRT